MTKTSQSQKLTKRIVDRAAPASWRYIIWDSDLPGFGLRVEPSGHKSFVARYRAGGGRAGRLRQEMVGRYGTVTAEQGRRAARKLLGAASAGGDPVGDKRAARQSGKTVAEVCDWYLREAAAGRILGRRGRAIKPSTLATDRGRIEAHVKPLLGKKAVRSLSLHDIEEMQADIAAGKTARPVRGKRPLGGIVVGGDGAGGRTLAMLRAIFEHAVRRQLVAVNPAKGARKLANQPRKFRLTLDQIRALGDAMRESAAGSETPTALDAIRLLLLTGFRRGEVLGLRPEWLMLAGGVDFPDTKSGPQARPVGRAAMVLLKARAASATEWIFPAERGDGHYVGLPRVLARLCKRARLKNVTPHCLRHTFASIAAELSFSELTIAGLLGHAAGSVTASYVHLDTALVVAADRVSTVIAAALDGKPAAQLVRLRKGFA